MRRWLLVTCVLLAMSSPVAAWTEGLASAGRSSPAGEVPHAGELKALREILGGQGLARLLAFALVATAVGSVGLMLLAAALAPERVARAEQALRRGPWKAAFIGVVSVVLLLLATAVLDAAAKAGARGLAILGLVVVGFLAWLAVHGLAAAATIIGRRLLRDEAGTQSAWRVVGAGGLVVASSLLVPIFGWAVFIYLFCRGVGAATIALFSAAAAAPEAGPEPPAETNA